MMAITHAAIAAAGTSLLFGTSDLTYLALAVVGSQLPDLDSTESVLGQICFPLSNWIENRYPHRSVTHSFVASAALAVGCMAVGYLVGGKLWAFIALPVGHLLARGTAIRVRAIVEDSSGQIGISPDWRGLLDAASMESPEGQAAASTHTKTSGAPSALTLTLEDPVLGEALRDAVDPRIGREH
jgi:hypothetical protein